MKANLRVIGLSLALTAGLLLVSGVAWAQAEETPIVVQDMGCDHIGEPEREWVDEDGIWHVRDQLFSCRYRRDMVGSITGWSSWDRDPAAGHLSGRGYYAFTGRVLGGEMTGAVARFTGEGNRIEGVWTMTEEHVMHLDGGGLIILSGTWESGAPRIILRGTLLDPPGGESRQGPRRRR